MTFYDHRPPRIESWKRGAVFLLVVLLHLLLFWWLALLRAASMPVEPLFPPFEVRLFGGGGSPAQAVAASSASSRTSSAPSALHVPSETFPWEDPLVALPEPAPPEPLVGFGSIPDVSTPISAPQASADADVAAEAFPSATPSGAGGQGGGSGGGVGTGQGAGAGAGPGSGGGAGAVLIRGPVGATITPNVSAGALAATPGQHAVLRCQIRLNQRVDNCRVLSEHPQGAGAGRRALERAEEFRFRPPRVGSRYRDRHWITIAVAFPPEPEAADPS